MARPVPKVRPPAPPPMEDCLAEWQEYTRLGMWPPPEFFPRFSAWERAKFLKEEIARRVDSLRWSLEWIEARATNAEREAMIAAAMPQIIAESEALAKKKIP